MKIAFTSGTLANVGDYFELTLRNGDAVVYRATITADEAKQYTDRYATITLI